MLCADLLHVLLHLLLSVVAEDLGHECALPELGGLRRPLTRLYLLLAPDGVVLLEALVLHPELGDEAPARHVHSLVVHTSVMGAMETV